MTDAELETLRYPVGRFAPIPVGSASDRAAWIDAIERAPAVLASTVRGLDARQMATPYRDGGWTVAQTVHHVADSHTNACIRTRFILTEDDFTVKPYQEHIWATLADAHDVDVTPSLDLLRALHRRWVTLLRSLEKAQFGRPYVHPESGPGTLDTLIQLYAWHGRHHTTHILNLKRREGWA